jgi:hypothetical protein
MGIHHLDHGVWRREDDWPAVESIVSDGANGLYANRPMQAVMHLTPGHAETIWAGDAIAIGFIRTIKRIGPYLYMGGEKGLARYDGTHIAVVEARNHPWLSGITGLAIGARDAWVITSDGIMRMAATDLDRAFGHPERLLPHQAMGQGMGVGSRSFAYTANDAEIDARGQAWFVTDKGLFRVDPARSERNPVAPPVTLRALIANGVRYQAGDVTLPAGTSRIQLDFVALSLTTPARNLYRYRLDGVDEGWVDAGHKRQANYTGLGPGEYHFRVIAANGDGVWNREGAVMTITIKPWFWQTWWFRGRWSCWWRCRSGLWSNGGSGPRRRLRDAASRTAWPCASISPRICTIRCCRGFRGWCCGSSRPCPACPRPCGAARDGGDARPGRRCASGRTRPGAFPARGERAGRSGRHAVTHRR